MTLMLGAAPQSFARAGKRGRRDRGLHHSTKGPKGFTTTSASPVSDSFNSNFSGPSTPTLSVENVQIILNTKTSQALASKPSKDRKGQSSLELQSRERLSERQSLLQSQWSKSHKMTPLQLLEALRHALETEEPAMRFDYFSMHIRCFEILRQLRHDADFGDKYIENDAQLPTVVSWIFRVAAANATNAQLSRTLRGLDVGSAMMTKAAGVLKKVIDREGRMESEKLGKICVHWQESPESMDDGEIMV
jgi:hypothetical protein